VKLAGQPERDGYLTLGLPLPFGFLSLTGWRCYWSSAGHVTLRQPYPCIGTFIETFTDDMTYTISAPVATFFIGQVDDGIE